MGLTIGGCPPPERTSREDGAVRRSGGARRLSTAALAVVALAVPAAACSDDGDEPGRDRPTTTPPAGDLESYCAKVFDFETFPEPQVDLELLTPEQQAEEVRRFARQVQPLTEDIRAVAPGPVRADFDVVADAVAEVARTGDRATFERPDVATADDRAHAFDVANCGWARADVTAVDYAFEGVPPMLSPGIVSLDLANRGAEPHELVLLRIDDAVTQPFAELLAMGEEELMARTNPVAGTFADAGRSEHEVVELEPGRYGVACFIPVGGGEEGAPHVTRGMFAELVVR
jgi:hypothetical protein